LFPNSRSATLALARRALGLLSDYDQYALVAERAIASGDDAMTRAVSCLIGAAVIVARRLPVLPRAFVAKAFFDAGRELMNSYTYDENEEGTTIH
jgi:hypothetical protein